MSSLGTQEKATLSIVSETDAVHIRYCTCRGCFGACEWLLTRSAHSFELVHKLGFVALSSQPALLSYRVDYLRMSLPQQVQPHATRRHPLAWALCELITTPFP